jgi:hypothetical protein
MDFGGATANRPRDINVARNVLASGYIAASGATYSSVIGYNGSVGGYFQCGANSTLVGLCSPNTDNLTPVINGATKNNAVDLGKSTIRFRTLYSVGANVSGTMTANALSIAGDSSYGTDATFTYITGSEATHRTSLKVPASDPTLVSGSTGVSNIVSLSLSDYNAIVAASGISATTFYIIV